MKKIIQIKLTGKFAHFNYPFTSPNFLKKSFSIPPRTTILGIIGAMIGLEGFQQYHKREEPEYYEKLKNIQISIGLNDIPLKQLIKYNSLNSFANDAKQDSAEGKCNIIIKEEILLNPEYTISFLLDDSKKYDKKILKSITKEKVVSVYPIYLGKNEFFANIEDVKIFNEDDFEFDNYGLIDKLNSIIPLDKLNEDDGYENLIYDIFSENIDFKNKKMRTKICKIGYFLKDELIEFKEKVKLYKIENKYYYFFK
jgi:CRISPR-associated protein Cas5h